MANLLIAGATAGLADIWPAHHRQYTISLRPPYLSLQVAGIELYDLELLTGLPEYRNGGLFVDIGVLVPINSEMVHKFCNPTIQQFFSVIALPT